MRVCVLVDFVCVCTLVDFVCLCVCLRMCVCVCLCAFIRERLRMYLCVCLFICACVCVCWWMCVCVYINVFENVFEKCMFFFVCVCLRMHVRFVLARVCPCAACKHKRCTFRVFVYHLPVYSVYTLRRLVRAHLQGGFTRTPWFRRGRLRGSAQCPAGRPNARH